MTTTKLNKPITSEQVDAAHMTFNQGLLTLCHTMNISGTPATLEREALEWILTEFEIWEVMHLIVLIIAVGIQTDSYDVCARYALNRENPSMIPALERGFLDVLFHALDDHGHGAADAARLIETLSAPLLQMMEMTRGRSDTVVIPFPGAGHHDG